MATCILHLYQSVANSQKVADVNIPSFCGVCSLAERACVHAGIEMSITLLSFPYLSSWPFSLSLRLCFCYLHWCTHWCSLFVDHRHSGDCMLVLSSKER